MDTSRAPPHRAAFLDGLRGIAALLVVVTHCTAALFPAVIFGTSSDDLARVLYGTPFLDLPFQGNFMVCVFYALSGLALSYHTLQRSDRTRAVSGLVRRYPRLMVPTLGGMLVAFVILTLGFFPVREASLISGSPWWGKYWQFAPNLGDAIYEGTVSAFTTGATNYDRPLWTMHGEIVGSLLVFAVLILAPRRWVRVVAYVVLAFLTYQSYLFAFVGGMVICEVWVAFGDRVRRWAPLLIPVGIYGLLLGSFPLPRASTPAFYESLLPDFFGTEPGQKWGAAHIVGAVLVLAAVVTIVPLHRPLNSKALQFLGRISFPLYILHFLVLGSVGAALLIALQDVLPYTLNALVVTAVVIAVSIGVAWVFTLFVDEPTVRLTGRAYRRATAWLRRSNAPDRNDERRGSTVA